MEKLEIKHLAPYLPYGVKIQYLGNEIVELVGFNKNTIYHTTGFFVELPCNIKPILRPLDLTKEIEHNGEKFVPSLKLDMIRKDICVYQYINPDYPIEITIQTENYSQEVDLFDGYLVMQKLIEWHFDVFSLIEKGLAINRNEI